MTTIRGRLLLWLLTGLLLASGLAGFFSYVTAQEEVNGLFDYHLREVALSYRHQVVAQQRAANIKDGEEEDDLFVQIWGLDENLVFVSDPGPTFPRLRSPGLGDFTWQGSTWRGYLIEDEGRLIEVAQPLWVRRDRSAGIAFRNTLPSLMLIPILGLVIWIAVGRGLRPLQSTAEDLQKRNPDAVAPLPEDRLPGEIQPLVHALNDLLRKLGAALATQRQFVADAAHELRTPLTVLRLQLEIMERSSAAEDRDSAQQRLKQALMRVSHLVQQLLMLARLEPEGRGAEQEVIDINSLARSALAEHATLAETLGIDLGLARNEEVRLIGDGESLRCALVNLLDNAIRYTPPGGRVDVSVWREGGFAMLQVEDNGIGIPAEDRARVFDRFYRVPGNDQPGSGLGLSIVKMAVERHQGAILLSEGRESRGLRATIRLPDGWQHRKGDVNRSA